MPWWMWRSILRAPDGEGAGGGGDGGAGAGGGQGGAAGGGAGDGGSAGAGSGATGAAGAGGAADPAAAAAAAAAAGAGGKAQLPGWYGQMSEQRRTALANHNFASVDALADRFLQLESEAGSNRVVLPGENATPEQVKAFHTAIGVPADEKGYQFPTEGADPLMVGWAGKAFLKYGVPAKAAAGLAADWNGFVAEVVQQRQTEAQAALKEDDGQLRVAWRGDYDKNVAIVNRLATHLEWPPEAVGELARSVGYVKGMQGLLKLAGLLDGGAHPSGGSTFSVSTAQEAEAELARMIKDPAMAAALRDPSHPEHKTLNDKRDRLHEIKTGIRMPQAGGR